MNSKTFKKELWFILGVLVLAFLISLTNPLNPFNKSGYIKIDSSVFAYIGKAMYEYKQIPYVDLFDHKGLFLYFINYAGYALAGLHGIWFIELIFNTISLYLVFKISSLFTKNKYITILTTVLIGIYFVQYNSGGNFSETYAFPILLSATYIFSNYFLQKSGILPKKEILLLGGLLGLVLMLRPNMIGIWGGFILLIVIDFIMTKKFRDLFTSIFLFIIGLILVLAPFILYLYKHNAIQAFITCYWSANLLYSETSFNIFILNSKHFATFNPIFFITLLVYLYKSYKKKKKIYLGFLFSWLFSIPLTAMSGKTYSHYAIVILPLIIYPITFITSQFFKLTQKKKSKILYNISTLLTLSFIVFTLFYSTYIILEQELMPYEGFSEISEFIINNSTINDEIIFIGPGNNLYLSTNRRAASRFFYQQPIANKIPTIITSKEFLNDLNINKPVFIILYGDLRPGLEFEWNVKKYISEVVENNTYKIIDNHVFNKNITIYQLVK